MLPTEDDQKFSHGSKNSNETKIAKNSTEFTFESSDENNNEECGWDGGDCCGDNVNTQYCSACECLDPNAGGPTTAPPPPVTTEGPSDACGSPQWFVIFLNILKYIA